MDLMYLSVMPVRLVHDVYLSDLSLNNSVVVDSFSSIQTVLDVSTIFNMVGCPLLLTCMCIERYLAVNRPVLYVRLRKWEYRAAVSAVVWCVTLLFCLTTGLLRDSGIIVILVSVMVSFLFVLMLACLGGVVRSLRQQSPAHRSNGFFECIMLLPLVRVQWVHLCKARSVSHKMNNLMPRVLGKETAR
ncbi:uncharacterized protein V6R79_020743 [Siganus canaliculatus]